MKIKKKFIAIIVCLLLTFNITANSYTVAYASGFEGAILGGGGSLAVMLSAPEVLIACGLLLGAYVVVDNWDDIEPVISQGVNDFGAWLDRACHGFIDTSSKAFSNIKTWIYSQTGVMQDSLTSTSLIGYYAANGSYPMQYRYGPDPSVDAWKRFYLTEPWIMVYYTNTANENGLMLVRPRTQEDPLSVRVNYTGGRWDSSGLSINGNPYFYIPISIPVPDADNFPFLIGKSTVSVPFAHNAHLSSLAEYFCTNYFEAGYNIVGNVDRFGYITDVIPQEGLSDVNVVPVDGTDVITLPVDWSNDRITDGLKDGTLTYEDVLDMTDSIPIVTDDDVVYPINREGISADPFDPPTGSDIPASGFTISGLERLFPFCIPFDLYYLFAALIAEPEAPNFTWEFYVLGETYDINIDLSDYDTAAQLLRDMLIILFILGLALKTRDLIRG